MTQASGRAWARVSDRWRRFWTLLSVFVSIALPIGAQSWTGTLVGVAVEQPDREYDWYLQVADGESFLLDAPESQLSMLGPIPTRSGLQIEVTGTLVQTRSDRTPVLRASQLRSLGGAPALRSTFTGSLPFVVLNCRYADRPGVQAVHDEFWPTLLGDAAPSLNHYFREVSGNQFDLAGSVLEGTYVLPLIESQYRTQLGSTDLLRIVGDCASAADPSVNFGGFQGIIVQVNGNATLSGGMAALGPVAFNVDGTIRQLRSYAVSPGSSQKNSAHEIGHTLGLLHTGTPGAPAFPYDSRWDLMSNGVWLFGPTTPGQSSGGDTWYTGVHLLGNSKELLGWLPTARVFRAPSSGTSTIQLERSALPVGQSSYLLAILPDPVDATSWYTVELRKFAGYDSPQRCVNGSCITPGGLPGEGVLITHTRTSGSLLFTEVVDGDGDLDVNDEGAMWTSGESFADGNGLVIQVESISATSAQVTITSGAQVPLSITTPSTLPDGLVGQPYSVPLQATGGTGGYLWSLEPGSQLPAGLNLSSGGLISGTPTLASGPVVSTVRVTSGSQSLTRQFTMTVTGGLTITTASPLPDAPVGIPYSLQFAATGSTGTAQWSVVGGTAPPSGLTLSATGLLSGTPTSAGSVTFGVRVAIGGSSVERSFTLSVIDGLVITTASPLPAARVAQPYSVQLGVIGGSGSPVWSLDPGVQLPPGVALAQTGLIAGTPTQQGSFSFGIRVTRGALMATRTFVVVVQGAELNITTAPELPTAVVGQPYSKQLEATGGSQPVVWSLVAGSALPLGLTLSPAGLVSGVPTGGGSSSFSIRAQSGSEVDTRAFSLVTVTGLAISTPSNLPVGVATTPYSLQLEAVGGSGGSVWSVAPGGVLPSGITLSPNGLLSGVPQEFGTFSFGITVSSGQESSTQQFTLMVEAMLVIGTATPLPAAEVGVPYEVQFSVTGGIGEVIWVVAPESQLPVGLTMTASGVLSGTPTLTGTFSFIAQVTRGHQTARSTYSLLIAAPLVVSTGPNLAAAAVGEPVSVQFSADGGVGEVAWSLEAGSTVPAGLSFSSAGMLTGLPIEAGTAAFTVRVDRGGRVATRTVHITIAFGGILGKAVGQLGGGSRLTGTQRTWFDGLGNKNGVLDVGDLLALLDRNPGAVLSIEDILMLQRIRTLHQEGVNR